MQSLYFHVHTEHLVFGFILEPTGHWNTELKRFEFIMMPSTRSGFGACSSNSK